MTVARPFPVARTSPGELAKRSTEECLERSRRLLLDTNDMVERWKLGRPLKRSGGDGAGLQAGGGDGADLQRGDGRVR